MLLIDSIYAFPDQWRQTPHTLKHNDGTEVWTSNGFLFYAPYPGGSWSLWQKFRFWRAYRWFHANRLVNIEVTQKVLDSSIAHAMDPNDYLERCRASMYTGANGR